MTPHRYAELFPIMGPAELDSLAADIKQFGQRAPITLLGGQILDGRNRFLACQKNGMTPKTREFTGEDPLEFVISVNLHRRHLTESQRAMIAAGIANLPHGRAEKKKEANLPLTPPSTEKNVEKSAATKPPTIAQAAAKLSVSPRLVREAKTVLSDKREAAAVVNGSKTVHAAAKAVRAKKEEKEVHRDETGYAIPDSALPLWNRRQEVKDILRAISTARAALKGVMEARKEGEEDMLFASANINGAWGKLSDAWTTVGMALPYAVCPTCQGRAPDNCLLCKGRAFISKHIYDCAVSVELKEVRAKSCVF